MGGFESAISAQFFAFLGVLVTSLFAYWGLARKAKSDEKLKAMELEDFLNNKHQTAIDDVTQRVGVVEVRIDSEEVARKAADKREEAARKAADKRLNARLDKLVDSTGGEK